jgi:hypothetical protein
VFFRHFSAIGNRVPTRFPATTAGITPGARPLAMTAGMAAFHERGNLRCEPAKLPRVEGVPPLRGENARAEFEDDALAFTGHDGRQENGKFRRGESIYYRPSAGNNALAGQSYGV